VGVVTVVVVQTSFGTQLFQQIPVDCKLNPGKLGRFRLANCQQGPFKLSGFGH
jgi:hypothetical protein